MVTRREASAKVVAEADLTVVEAAAEVAVEAVAVTAVVVVEAAAAAAEAAAVVATTVINPVFQNFGSTEKTVKSGNCRTFFIP